MTKKETQGSGKEINPTLLEEEQYRYPTLVFHCAKCGKPYQIAAMACRLNTQGCVEFNELIRTAADNNERLSIYYGDENPLNDGCKCEEE